MGGPSAHKRTLRRRVVKRLRKRGWSYETPNDGIRHRIYDILASYHAWWDWGHYLMILTGTDFCGNWAEPEAPTWWYKLEAPKRMFKTRYPIHPLSTFKVIKNYDAFMALTEDLNEDKMYEWQAFNVSQDRELQVGHMYWGGRFFGMTRWEVRLLVKYLRMVRRHDWYGLRTWLYAQGLHATVYKKKPFSCGAAPEPGSGGYDHWLCQLKKRHKGEHKCGNYVWGELDGVKYSYNVAPEDENVA